MTKISLIRPLDQPIGTRRLLSDLKLALDDRRFIDFRLIVAYAKSGPLLRLREHLKRWRDAGKTAQAIIGIDQQGTSQNALELALELCDTVYITQEGGITFHPKIYCFKGISASCVFVGSNNLTVGGTEKNFEAAIQLDFSLPSDELDFGTFELAWSDLLPESCPATRLLTPQLMADLVASGVVIPENFIVPSIHNGHDSSLATRYGIPKSGLKVKPESPLPKELLKKVKKSPNTKSSKKLKGNVMTSHATVTPRGLAIQIRPHHNGEIFLSVTAVYENPSFFGWPFTGSSVPKKNKNSSYPQRIPDPVANITVYGASKIPVLILPAYGLNTVYYETKSEIRITASPLVDIVPEYSIMVMEYSGTHGVDYEITIHRPDSPDYRHWLNACNQTMPGGGKEPRKYGWF